MSLRSALAGPPIPLPRRVDGAARWWAQQPPRMRTALVALLIGAVCVQCVSSRAALHARWGGEGVPVWRAERTILAGGALAEAVTEVRLPPIAVPADALTHPPPPGSLAVVPVFEGAVLVEGHLSSTGLAADLPEGHRLVAVPTDPGWGVSTGSVVDVWVLQGPPRLLLERSVVQAVQGRRDRLVALLVVEADDVADLTAALADSEVRLTVAGTSADLG